MNEDRKAFAFGLPYYPKQRDDQFLPKLTDWLHMKRQLDNVHFLPQQERTEHDSPTTTKINSDITTPLWRIHNKLYDFRTFNHPGGQIFLEIGQNMDITEVFESSHYDIDKARALLDKYYVRDCHPDHVRFSFLTFHKDGFYDRLRSKVHKIMSEQNLVERDRQCYLWSSRFYHDTLFITHLILVTILIACSSDNGLLSNTPLRLACTILAGLVFGLVQPCAHNFFHKKDSWRIYTFDLSMSSTYEWRVTHVYSHHNFTNSLMDFEMQAFEPIVYYLPFKGKDNWIYKIVSVAAVCIILPLVSIIQVRYTVLM